MITLPKVVSLTTEDYLIALECAKLRWRDSLRDGRRDSVRPKSWQEALVIHHQGACAELAVAKAFGIYCPLHVNQFSGMQSDLPGNISVRWSKRGTLVVRPNDSDGTVVLVTGDAPDLEILGWALVQDVKQQPLVDPGGMGKPCHMMDAHLLNKQWG